MKRVKFESVELRFAKSRILGLNAENFASPFALCQVSRLAQKSGEQKRNKKNQRERAKKKI